jgi:hypothetical protein
MALSSDDGLSFGLDGDLDFEDDDDAVTPAQVLHQLIVVGG